MKMAGIKKTFDYYHSRVLEVARLYGNEDFNILNNGKEKIENLLEGYKKFPQYNSFLVSAIKDLLREN